MGWNILHKTITQHTTIAIKFHFDEECQKRSTEQTGIVFDFSHSKLNQRQKYLSGTWAKSIQQNAIPMKTEFYTSPLITGIY